MISFATIRESDEFLELWTGGESWIINPTSFLTGTLSGSTTILTGVGTLFNTELVADDYVYADSNLFKVVSVDSDFQITVDVAPDQLLTTVACSKLTTDEVTQYNNKLKALQTSYYKLINLENYQISGVTPPSDINLVYANSVYALELFSGVDNVHQKNIEAGIESLSLGRKSVSYKDAASGRISQNVHQFIQDYYLPVIFGITNRFDWDS